MQPESGADDGIEISQFLQSPRIFAKSAQDSAQLEQPGNRSRRLNRVVVQKDVMNFFTHARSFRDARPGGVDPIEYSAVALDRFALQKLEIFLPLTPLDFDAEPLALMHAATGGRDLGI